MKIRNHILLSVLLFASCVFFLWMFLAAGILEQAADAGHLTGMRGQEVQAAAHNFSNDWKHGMAGNSPLYVPGYFLVSISSWFWGANRRIKNLLIEGSIILSLATVTTILLNNVGADIIFRALQQETGIQFNGILPEMQLTLIARGGLALAFWCSLILSLHRAIASHSIIPLWLPLLFCIVLMMVRPVATLGRLCGVWADRILQGDIIAIFSLVMIPAIAIFLVKMQRHRGGS